MDEDNERSVSSQIIRLSSVFFVPMHTQRENTKTPSITTETRTRYLIAVR